MSSKSTPVKTVEPDTQQRPGAIDAAAFIALVPMRPYDVIGDVRSGHGNLTLPLARYAYGGKVYAIDTDQKALDAIAEKAKQARLGNIECLLSKESSVPLDDGTLDGAVVADALLGLSRPKPVIKEISRLLRKGGWLAVIAPIGSDQRGNGHRRTHEEALELATEAGFKKTTARALTHELYLIVLTK